MERGLRSNGHDAHLIADPSKRHCVVCTSQRPGVGCWEAANEIVSFAQSVCNGYRFCRSMSARPFDGHVNTIYCVKCIFRTSGFGKSSAHKFSQATPSNQLIFRNYFQTLKRLLIGDRYFRVLTHFSEIEPGRPPLRAASPKWREIATFAAPGSPVRGR